MYNRLSALALLLTLICASCDNSKQDGSALPSISNDDSTEEKAASIETSKQQQPQALGRDTIVSDSVEVERWLNPNAIDTTLLFFEGTTVSLSSSDVKPSQEEYFIDSKALVSLTEKYQNAHRLALAIERIQVEKFGQDVRRDSSGLFIRLRNNSWKKLIPNEEFDEADVTFEYYFEEFGYYSIRIQWGEGNGYLLVNDSTGAETRMYGRPYFSPSGDRILSVSCDIEAGYSSNGFELYEVQFGELVRFGAFNPKSWGPVKVNWIDDDHAILTSETFEFRNGDMQYFQFNTAVTIGIE